MHVEVLRVKKNGTVETKMFVHHKKNDGTWNVKIRLYHQDDLYNELPPNRLSINEGFIIMWSKGSINGLYISSTNVGGRF